MKTKISKFIRPHEAVNQYLEKMMEMDLLQQGKTISASQTQEILDCEYVNENDWNFLGKYLSLKSLIESKGFFVTQTDLVAPSFRILFSDEMAAFAEKKLTKALFSNYKTNYILGAHNSSSLNEREKKVFDSVKLKASQIVLAQQKIMLDDFFF